MRYLYLFIVSGDHPELGISEVRSLLKARDLDFYVIDKRYKLLRVESPASPRDVLRATTESSCLQELVLERASICSEEINLNNIIEIVKEVDWSYLKGKSFSVLVNKIGNISVPSPEIAKEVGKIIMEKTNFLSKVDLRYPDRKVEVVLYKELAVIGDLIWKFRRDRFDFRSPSKRPVFSPCALRPTLSKLLINLALKKQSQMLLDPFCGVGSVLIEASLMNMYSVGVDLNKDLVRGARVNSISFSSYSLMDLIVADSKKIPVRKNAFDMVVTDLPYGRLSPTYSSSSRKLVEEFLRNLSYVLKEKSKAVFIYDSEIPSSSLIKIREKHKIYVHKSLTRVIHLVEKHQDTRD